MSEYYIPANYTDAGRLLGLFEIRNTVEAIVLAVPLAYACFTMLPFSLTANLIITMIIVIPVGGFALIGLNDDCLTHFVRTWINWLRNRGIITYKGADRLKRKVDDI